MSFSTEVKKELLGSDFQPCCKKAFVAGIMQGTSDIVIKDNTLIIRLSSFMPSLIRFLVPYFKKTYNISVETYYLDKTNINNKRIYSLDIKDKSEEIINDFHLYPFDTYILNNNDCCKKAFIAGCFMSKGSINDPRKSSYHFEILFKKAEIATLCYNILKENNISSQISSRKNQTLLYIKKSEAISDALALMGAYSGVLHFEDLRIMRDMNNAVNRAMNCDIANYKRSLKSCTMQLEAIKFLKENELDKGMSQRLQDAMRLRETYPDSTLQELSDYSDNILGKHLSKSGISHCMREINNYYKDLIK